MRTGWMQTKQPSRLYRTERHNPGSTRGRGSPQCGVSLPMNSLLCYPVVAGITCGTMFLLLLYPPVQCSAIDDTRYHTLLGSIFRVQLQSSTPR